METNAVAEAVCDWARATIPGLAGGYAFLPAEKTEALPDVAVEVDAIRTALQDDAFPFPAIQQTFIKVWDLTLSFMVDNADVENASRSLRDYADALTISVMTTGTLDGRVPFVSPFVTFDYSAPFVEYDDGTRGREMTMTLAVGEPVQEQQ